MKESNFSKIFRDDIKRSLEACDQNYHINLIQDSYRSGKKPYDFYMVCPYGFIAFELKLIKGKSINFDCVLPHQLDALYEVKKSSPHLDTCLFRSYIVMSLYGYNSKEIIVFTPGEFNNLKKMANGAKSIKIDEIKSSCGSKYFENDTMPCSYRSDRGAVSVGTFIRKSKFEDNLGDKMRYAFIEKYIN